MFRGHRVLLFVLLMSFFAVCTANASGHGNQHPVKKGILLVAFGSSMEEAQVSFEKIDQKIHAAFPEVEVRWAFTSHIIREILAENGKKTMSPIEALGTMCDDGFTHVAVQSLHTIPGEEYDKLSQTVERFNGIPDGIQHIQLGHPLLYTSHDLAAAAKAMIHSFPKNRKKNEPVVLMGHGTHHAGDVYYSALQQAFDFLEANVLVGTVEGFPGLDEVLDGLKKAKATKVWMMPFMSVAGDHARNDMAGEEADSWKSVLAGKGYDVETVLKGTAELPLVSDLWLEHLKEAWSKLK